MPGVSGNALRGDPQLATTHQQSGAWNVWFMVDCTHHAATGPCAPAAARVRGALRVHEVAAHV